MKQNFASWKAGLRDGMPVCLGYLAVSFTFGIAAKNAGLTPFTATLMSGLNLTSAGQFAALGLIASSASYYEIAFTQLIINLRYSLMSCALSQKLSPTTPFFHRFLMAFGISDEIFALSAAVPGRLSPFYTYGLMSVAIPGWTLGTLMGILLGSVLPPRLLSAFSVALYGMFIAVIIPPAKHSKVIRWVVILSMAASGLFSLVPLLRQISSGFKIILLTLIIAGGAAALFPIHEKGGTACVQ